MYEQALGDHHRHAPIGLIGKRGRKRDRRLGVALDGDEIIAVYRVEVRSRRLRTG